MTVAPPARINLIAVIVATTAALIGRAWLQVVLLAGGLPKDYAADLSYLVVPPILIFILAPVLKKDRTFLVEQFRYPGISFSIVFKAVLIGLLLRIASWARLIAGVSFGVYRSDDPLAIEGPRFAFHCASLHVVILGFVVMAIMVPVIEEVTHRAYIQSAFHDRGPFLAILVSATLFAIFHPPANWPFTFFAGVVLGAQYWYSGSLWPSLISHATVNGLIQVDWRCLNVQWNPQATDLPILSTGIPAVLVLLTSICAIFLLVKKRRGD